MRTFSGSFAAALMCLVFAGCRSEMAGEERASAYQSLDAGRKALLNKNYQESADKLAEATKSGGLDADSYADARIQLAVALGHLKRFVEAHEILKNLEQAPVDQARVHAARAAVYKAEGRGPLAAAELAKARQKNPDVELFD